MLYSLIKPPAKLAYSAYYRKLWVLNTQEIPQNEAVILVANHSNTFIDPTIIACWQSRHLHFWARANEFKKPILGWIARNVHILPIFRQQDGKANMAKNDQTFELSRALLRDKGLLFIAPEGNCELERRLRTLKPGAARLAYSFLQENPNRKLYILPTGLNFTDLVHSGGEAYVSFGQAFAADELLKNAADEQAFIQAFTEQVQAGIKSQMLHIDSEADDKWLPIVWQMFRNDRDYQADLQQDSPAVLFKKMQSLFQTTQHLPDFEKGRLLQNISEYSAILDKNGLQDLGLVAADKISILHFLSIGLVNLLIFTNTLLSFLPLALIRFICDKKVPDLAFRSSVGLAAGLFLMSFYYLTLSAIAAVFVGWWALLMPFVLYGLYFTAFHLSYYKTMLLAVVKYKRWRVKNADLNQKLLSLRADIAAYWLSK